MCYPDFSGEGTIHLERNDDLYMILVLWSGGYDA